MNQEQKNLAPATAGTGLEACLQFDWLARALTPAFLAAAGLEGEARDLANCPRVTDRAGVRAVQPAAHSAKRAAMAAWESAGNTAENGLRGACWDAALAAVDDAGGKAARDAAPSVDGTGWGSDPAHAAYWASVYAAAATGARDADPGAARTALSALAEHSRGPAAGLGTPSQAGGVSAQGAVPAPGRPASAPGRAACGKSPRPAPRTR